LHAHADSAAQPEMTIMSVLKLSLLSTLALCVVAQQPLTATVAIDVSAGAPTAPFEHYWKVRRFRVSAA